MRSLPGRRTLNRPAEESELALAIALGESRRTAELEAKASNAVDLAGAVMNGSDMGPTQKANHHAVKRALQTTLSAMVADVNGTHQPWASSDAHALRLWTPCGALMFTCHGPHVILVWQAASPSEIRRRHRIAAALAGRPPATNPHL